MRMLSLEVLVSIPNCQACGAKGPRAEQTPGALSAKLCLGSGVCEWALALCNCHTQLRDISLDEAILNFKGGHRQLS